MDPRVSEAVAGTSFLHVCVGEQLYDGLVHVILAVITSSQQQLRFIMAAYSYPSVIPKMFHTLAESEREQLLARA